MTLRELLVDTPFERIAPFIKQSEHPDQICHYKQAYDILLHIEACEKGCFDINVHLHDDNDGQKHICASQIEGDWWAEYIHGEIILEEGIEVSNEELAFKLLWHLTFYGYSPEQIHANLEGMGNDEFHETKYGRMAREISRKRRMLWANKAIRKNILESVRWLSEEGRNSFALSLEDWKFILNHKRHCNRMKRMRDYRLKKRQDKLKNLDMCENTIRRLLDGQDTTHVTRNDLAFLWNENGRWGNEFQTRAYNETMRMNYWDDIVTNYEALDVADKLSHAVVKISTSKESPLTDEESSHITKRITGLMGNDNLLVIKATEPSLGSEIAVMIVGIEKISE